MKDLDWKGAIWAGIIAGVVFMMLEMIMVPVFLDGSPWGPPRLIAAIVMGKDVLPPPADFALGMFIVAIIVHMMLSILFAIIIAYITKTMKFATALLVGGVLGLILYLVNFYLFTGIFPWFAKARHWVTIFTHVMFGIVAAWSYFKIRQPDTLTTAARTS